MAYTKRRNKNYRLILNHIAEIVWIPFDGGKGVLSVKYEISNNTYDGRKTCIVIVMDCQEKLLV
jgi:hypothetical protein